MVTAGFNPSTGKALYQSGTGKQCVGCCGGIVPGEPCSFCPTDTTPYSLNVSFSGLTDLCGGCAPNASLCPDSANRYASSEYDFSFADLANGSHVLEQVTSCFWRKYFPLGIDRKQKYACYAVGDCPDCSDPMTSIDAESIITPLSIEVRKSGATAFNVTIASLLTSTAAARWTAVSTGSTQCFEISGSYTYETSVLNLGLFGGSPLISDGNVTVSVA